MRMQCTRCAITLVCALYSIQLHEHATIEQQLVECF